jgi:HSP20 family protein
MAMNLERWRGLSGASDLGELQHDMNRLFDTFFGRPSTQVRATERVWAPLMDMRETKDDVVLTFDLPGISEKELSLTITGDVLTVRGERRFETADKDDSHHRVERVYGKFERTVALPLAVQADKVKATYRDGVLEVRLPKIEQVKPKQIKIDLI